MMDANMEVVVLEPCMYQIVEAFRLWEMEYRADPGNFMTAVQTANADITDLSELRALYFKTLLEKVMP